MQDDMMNRSPDKHEAAMARADLYKLANYSMKLFKMIHEGQELEGWVQAKITKAADYVSSVYHFMQYEMKTSDYGSKLENSDVYSESVRRAFEQKLMEAKKQAEKIKAKAEKMDEGFDDMEKWLKDKRGPQPSGGGGMKKGSRYGGSKQAADKEDDEDEGKKKDKKVKESSKPDYLDFDKDGNKKEPMKKALKDKKVKEELKGGQKKLDADKDGKLEKSDFAALRAKKIKEDARLSELKKSTLGSYVKKASKDAVKKTRDADAADEYGDPDEGDKLDKKAQKRMAGVNKAVDKLTKESASKCNQSPKGKSCPVHGLKECGSMSEAKNLKQQAAIAIAKKKAK